MPFIDKSTRTYPVTNSFPVRKWLANRDPVSGSNGDYKNFKIFDIWINDANDSAWIMVDRTADSGTWVQMASTGTGILSITGDSGGAVGPDGNDNIFLLSGDNLSIAGSPGSNTLTLSIDGSIADSYPTDSGTAVPSGGVLNVAGAGGTDTSGSGNTITITSGPTIPTTFTADSGSAEPAGNNLNVFGGTSISTSGATDTLTLDLDGDVANQYTCDAGIATPSGHNINVLGSGGLSTTGSGDTITIDGGVAWTEVVVVGPTQMVVNNGYIANNSSRVELTLPLTATVGDRVRVVGKGSGGWQINQNAGQIIQTGDSTTTTGTSGTLQSSEDLAAVELLCTTTDTTWTILSSVGNLIFN